MRIDLTVKGDEVAAERLRHFAANAEEARPFFQTVSRILMDETGDRFRRRGPGWDPLDRDTIRQKAKVGKGQAGILRLTGALYRALTRFRAPGQRLDIGDTELVFGLDRKGVAYYGAFHQTGKGVPQRRFLKKTARTKRRIREALLDRLMGHDRHLGG